MCGVHVCFIVYRQILWHDKSTFCVVQTSITWSRNRYLFFCLVICESTLMCSQCCCWFSNRILSDLIPCSQCHWKTCWNLELTTGRQKGISNKLQKQPTIRTYLFPLADFSVKMLNYYLTQRLVNTCTLVCFTFCFASYSIACTYGITCSVWGAKYFKLWNQVIPSQAQHYLNLYLEHDHFSCRTTTFITALRTTTSK